MTDENAIHELAAAYALDALDAGERSAFDAHLAECERCREAVASLGDAATALAYATGGAGPPDTLRDRILDAARTERETVVPLCRRRPPLAWAASVAAAAALAVGLGLWATLGTDGGSGREPIRVALSGAEGTLTVSRSGSALLTVSDLEPAPAGKTYEIWVIEGGRPQPAGTFEGGEERVSVPVEEDVPRGAIVAVTIEQAGGVGAPTSEPIFTAQVPV